MRRTEVLQGILLMKFEDILERTQSRELSQWEAASVLGVSERTFRRWRDRHEAEGASGLYDRRFGKVSPCRVPVDTEMEVLDLFDRLYFDFTARHFFDKLVSDLGFTRSYNWLRLMLHQDGSSHQWVGCQWWDLIVTQDDATSAILSAFFVEEEGTMSSFRGLREAISANGLFCALYVDRGSHYWHTPKAGGKVDRDNPTQVGRALNQLGIELIAAYSPEARGRSERMFGTLQKRLPQELRLAGIATMDEANRFLRETFLPDHNRRFAIAPEEPGSAFVAFAGALDDILCIQEERVVSNDNTVRYKGLALQVPEDRHRHHYVKARVRIHQYPGSHLAALHGPRRLATYNPDGTIKEKAEREVA